MDAFSLQFFGVRLVHLLLKRASFSPERVNLLTDVCELCLGFVEADGELVENLLGHNLLLNFFFLVVLLNNL